eukprot:jgi/Psemu1/304933/fgenesh1_kg.175_\
MVTPSLPPLSPKKLQCINRSRILQWQSEVLDPAGINLCRVGARGSCPSVQGNNVIGSNVVE